MEQILNRFHFDECLHLYHCSAAPLRRADAGRIDFCTCILHFSMYDGLI